MVYGYIRVSSDKQDIESQKIGVVSKVESLGLAVDVWIEDDGISGTKEPEERQLGKLLKKIKKGDTIVTSELSRLGRKLFMILRILEHCMSIGAKVYTVKDGYELGDNIQSKVLAFAFGLSAEIERNMISQRTKEGLQRVRNTGTVLGRPIGATSKILKLNKHESRIRKYLQKGLSYSAIARLLGVHRLTVSTFAQRQNFQKRILKQKRKDPTTVRFCPNFTKEELLDTLQRNYFSLSKTAQALNITYSELKKSIKTLRIENEVHQVIASQRQKFNPLKNDN